MLFLLFLERPNLPTRSRANLLLRIDILIDHVESAHLKIANLVTLLFHIVPRVFHHARYLLVIANDETVVFGSRFSIQAADLTGVEELATVEFLPHYFRMLRLDSIDKILVNMLHHDALVLVDAVLSILALDLIQFIFHVHFRVLFVAAIHPVLDRLADTFSLLLILLDVVLDLLGHALLESLLEWLEVQRLVVI